MVPAQTSATNHTTAQSTQINDVPDEIGRTARKSKEQHV